MVVKSRRLMIGEEQVPMLPWVRDLTEGFHEDFKSTTKINTNTINMQLEEIIEESYSKRLACHQKCKVREMLVSWL